VETVGPQARVDRARASSEDLSEIEEEMVLELESRYRPFVGFARALQQSSSVAPVGPIRLTCTYYAPLCRDSNRRKTGMLSVRAPTQLANQQKGTNMSLAPGINKA